MTYYPAPAINKALGLELAASLDDALTAITQLRASLEDVAELREAVHRLKSERDAARQGVMVHRDRVNELSAELKAAIENSEAGAAREAAEYQSIRRELDRAQADNAELRRQVGVLDRNTTEAERARDAAFVALHHATAAYL